MHLFGLVVPLLAGLALGLAVALFLRGRRLSWSWAPVLVFPLIAVAALASAVDLVSRFRSSHVFLVGTLAA